MKVTIDRSGCISCGLCEATCPEVFRIAADGLAEVYKQPDKEQEQGAAEAAEACPVSVIMIEE
ncbi:MAG: ferredoxin [Christensenellales bacterium]